MKIYLAESIAQTFPELSIYFLVIDGVCVQKTGKINSIVDLANDFIEKYCHPLTVFTSDALGELFIRFSQPGDYLEVAPHKIEYIPLSKLVVTDKSHIRAIFSEKDAYDHKVTLQTKTITLLSFTKKIEEKQKVKDMLTQLGKVIKGDTKSMMQEVTITDRIPSSNFTPTVMAGIRPTGSVHLGNYLGAIKNMVNLQHNGVYKNIYMVANLSAITTPYTRDQLPLYTSNVVLDYLAAGIDPEKSIIFLQSEVSQHTELAYLLSSIYSLAKLTHLPTFKEKIKQHPENVTLALLSYPILMAAGIMLYKSHLVPVGIDQEPHLEVTREIARAINKQYHMTFPEPQRFITQSQYIPSLTGQGKMSKSVPGSYIELMDSFEVIRKKIRGVPTSTLVGGNMTEGVKALFDLLSVFSKEDYDHFLHEYTDGSLQFIELKETLAEKIYHELEPIQERKQKLKNNKELVREVLYNGANNARKIAAETIEELKQQMGLLL